MAKIKMNERILFWNNVIELANSDPRLNQHIVITRNKENHYCSVSIINDDLQRILKNYNCNIELNVAGKAGNTAAKPRIWYNFYGDNNLVNLKNLGKKIRKYINKTIKDMEVEVNGVPNEMGNEDGRIKVVLKRKNSGLSFDEEVIRLVDILAKSIAAVLA